MACASTRATQDAAPRRVHVPLGAVALLVLLAAAAPARIVAPDLVLVVEDPLLDHRQRFGLLAVAGVSLLAARAPAAAAAAASAPEPAALCPPE